MVGELEKSSYLIISYREHTFRSYLGFIAWLIIATNENLYIMDSLKLRSYISDLIKITSSINIMKVIP